MNTELIAEISRGHIYQAYVTEILILLLIIYILIKKRPRGQNPRGL